MVYKVTTNLPTTTKISQLNDMLIETDGKTAQGQFDKIELDALYTDLGVSRLYARDIALGHLTTDYTDWTHLHAESGYSIWKLTKADYAYNANNQVFFDDRLMDFRGLAGSESVTTYDTAFTYDGSYVNVTTEMGTEGGTSVTVLEAIGDYLYLGSASTFSGAKLEFFTRGANNTLKVEYHSGSGWKTLTANTDLLVDNTANLASDGSITFTPPVDWDTVAVNSVTKYWIRLSTTTTPVTLAKVYYCIPYNSVIALLAMSSSQINNEEWAWCSYGTAIYVTLRNMGTTYYEGDYYINSSSTAANKLNYFVYNHEIKSNYRNTTTAMGQVKSAADASMGNNTVYYSTTQSKLVYKDSVGSTHALY
jgi:hypothetical protein